MKKRRRRRWRQYTPEKKGAMSEATVDCALRWLRVEFERSDGDGKDFIVITSTGERRYIEVKSSITGKICYFQRKEELRKRGQEVRDDVVVIVVNEYDTVFSIADQMKKKLS